MAMVVISLLLRQLVTMAMMDNVDFLISHIRHCFITSDDTGMCELIIDCENNNNNNNNSQGSGCRSSGHWKR